MALEHEVAVYRSHLMDLLANEGKYVVIKGDEIVPEAFDAYEEALKEGYERYGPVPFLVKKVSRTEPVLYFTRDLSKCRSSPAPLDPRHGAVVWVKVMQSPEYIAALKKAGLTYATPVAVLGILDTGASMSAVDNRVAIGMSLQNRGSVEIHTPSTGEGQVVHRDSFDATLVIGESQPVPLSLTTPVIACDFASRGFMALIGRDVLNLCVLTFNGPAGRFPWSGLTEPPGPPSRVCPVYR